MEDEYISLRIKALQDDTETIWVHLPAYLRQRLRAAAKARGRTPNGIIVKALFNFLHE